MFGKDKLNRFKLSSKRFNFTFKKLLTITMIVGFSFVSFNHFTNNTQPEAKAVTLAADPLTIPACNNNPECFAFTIDTRLQSDGSTTGVDTTFSIPLSGRVNNVNNTANWIINWGDGNIETPGSITGSTSHVGISHTYSTAGQYQITIRRNGTATTGWLNAFGFYINTSGANTNTNKYKFRSIDTPFTNLMRSQSALYSRFAYIFSGAKNGTEIPSNLFSNILTTSATTFYSMFSSTFSGYASNSTSATIPSNLFSSLNTSSGTNFTNMFMSTFSGYASNSTSATIPSNLFSSLNTSSGTTFSSMFSSTFSGYASNSTSATIPYGLFGSISTSKNTSSISQMFYQTFANCASNSTSATIPSDLFSTINITVGTEFTGMFRETFVNYAYSSTSGTIPSSLFGNISTSSNASFSNIFNKTFSRYAYNSTSGTVPDNLFNSIDTSNVTDFSYMFMDTFSEYAYSSTSATIPSNLFSSLNTSSGTTFSSMFSGTFEFHAYSSTSATIPSNLFSSLNTSSGTTFSSMFSSTFYGYAYNSTSGTIPAGLFSFLNTINGTSFNNMFRDTFYGYAYNSTSGIIPEGLFSSINTSNIGATNFAYMFYRTFNSYAWHSSAIIIPYDLFDFLDTTNGTSFTNMFQDTFTSFAHRAAKFMVNGLQVGSDSKYYSPYSVKIGSSGTPSTNPTVDATTGSQVVPTYNASTRSISIPSGYGSYTWFYKDGTSCEVTTPTPDCGPQDSTTKYTGSWPNTTEWTQTTSTEKGSVTFYGLPLPKISSINPNTGPHTGGQNIEITGTNFTDVTSVTIGGNACQSFTINSSTSITCITPAGNAGPADVVVYSSDGADTLTDGYTYYLGPVINNVSPNTGSSGTDITITGENFGSVTLGPGTPTDFSTCGTPQAFTATETGAYQLEAWGASAGKASRGAGGYTTGTVNLTAGQTIYVYVGCRGTGTGVNTASEVTYVFNGGAYVSSSSGDSGGGGGATDFRITNGDWNNTTSLESRILVAGGGGGGYNANATQPGNQSGSMNGGINGTYTCTNTAGTGMGVAGFGVGGARLNSDDYGGGGGGWYGGCSTGDNTGGGGSGYTYTAANATASGIAGPGSQYYLTDTNIIAGNTTIPTPAGGTATGRINSNGYARITPIDTPINTITLDPNGTPADCQITSWTDTEIHCLTSDHTPGLVDIELYNGTDTATKDDVFTYLEPTLTLSLDSSNLLLGGSTTTPTPTGTFVSASNTANVITNNVLGYSLSISTDKPSTDTNSSNMEHLSLPGNYLLATSNTCTWNSTTKILTNTTTSLSNNTWGFTLNNTNLTNQQLCKVPNQTSPLTIKQTTTPTDQDTGDDTTIFYGSKIDTNQVAGQYEARVLYTGVVNI